VEGVSISPSGRGVYGRTPATAGTSYGGYFESASTSGSGVYGEATATSGSTFGGRFENASTDGRGVYGVASAANGFTYGVYGQSDSTSGRGVHGSASAGTGTTFGGVFSSASTSGTGVAGVTTATTGSTYGVHGVTLSTTGRGVYGLANATSGVNYGEYGQSDSISGRGVYGLATATPTTTITYGVYGQADGVHGNGVYGVATATTGNCRGGLFLTNSPSGTGVYGHATANTGTNYGVYGATDSEIAGYGVFSWGRFAASGSKSLRIDHPEDPANKYLLHYCTESPEVLNAYSGTVAIDGAGGAVVELPRYFARINKDPRYTLTALGAPMPMLHVAAGIDEADLNAAAAAGPDEPLPLCSFRIAGGAPGATVCWRVEAVRNDRWVRAYGAPVEVEKEGLEKGTYQHPELYGQPAHMGMGSRFTDAPASHARSQGATP
jgi:hypothetical protein